MPMRHHAQTGLHRLIPVCLSLLLAFPILNFPVPILQSTNLPACCRNGKCPMRTAMDRESARPVMTGMLLPHRCSDVACICTARRQPATPVVVLTTPRFSPSIVSTRFHPARQGGVTAHLPVWTEDPLLPVPSRPPRSSSAIYFS